MTSAAKLRLSTFGAWHDDDVPCSPRTCLPARRMSAAGPSIMRYYSSLRRSPSNQLAVPTFELPHKENIEVTKRSLRVAALVALCGESVQTFHVSLLLPAIRFSGTAKRRMSSAMAEMLSSLSNAISHLSFHRTLVIHLCFVLFLLSFAQQTNKMSKHSPQQHRILRCLRINARVGLHAYPLP